LSKENRNVCGCVVGIRGLAGFIWSIVSGVYMLQGKINDGRGYALDFS
jgi:hypothetical protein